MTEYKIQSLDDLEAEMRAMARGEKRDQMSFDNIETPKLRRMRLAHALRHIDEFENYTWDFTQVGFPRACGTVGCAMGLALVLWPDLADLYSLQESVAVHFGLTAKQVDQIFLDVESIEGSFYHPGKDSMKFEVTPEMVADALDAV